MTLRLLVLAAAVPLLTACASTDTVATNNGNGSMIARGVANAPEAVYVMKHDKSTSSTMGVADITYPVFPLRLLPSAHALNRAVGAFTRGWHCDPATDGFDPKQFEFDGMTTMDDVNKKFISLHTNTEITCGGAYPDSEFEYHVFNTATGREVSMKEQFVPAPTAGAQAGYSALERLAQTYQPKENVTPDCYPSGTDQKSQLDQLSMYDYTAGLSGHDLMINVSPPHALQACGFTVKVPYASAKSFILAGSILNSWLK